jgi:hypothetical protein
MHRYWNLIKHRKMNIDVMKKNVDSDAIYSNNYKFAGESFKMSVKDILQCY